MRGWGRQLPDAAPAIADAYEQSLLYGEHTWGGSIGWINNKLSFGDAFQKDRAAGRFNRIESSWEEHTAYIRKAHAIIAPALEGNMQALAQAVKVEGQRVVVYNPLPWKRSGVVSLKAAGFAPAALRPSDSKEATRVDVEPGALTFLARDIPPMGYRTYVAAAAHALKGATSLGTGRMRRLTSAATALHSDPASATMQSPFFSAKLDPSRGIVLSLVDKRSGRELAGNTDGLGLGQYLYERFDKDRTMQWCKDYVRAGQLWADFYKPGQPPSDQFPYQAASPKDFKLRFEETATSVNAIMEAAATGNLPAVTTRLILYRDQPCADLEITLHDKPFEPWPEAGWLCLPLNVTAPQFRLGRLGSIIDPARDIVTGANRHMFGINTGLSMTDDSGRGVGFCPIDYPLVSLDTPGCWRYSLDFVPRKPVAYVNLFNNQWNTNFRLWNRGTWTSSVRLWAVEQLRRGVCHHHAFARSAVSAAGGDGRRPSRHFADPRGAGWSFRARGFRSPPTAPIPTAPAPSCACGNWQASPARSGSGCPKAPTSNKRSRWTCVAGPSASPSPLRTAASRCRSGRLRR